MADSFLPNDLSGMVPAFNVAGEPVSVPKAHIASAIAAGFKLDNGEGNPLPDDSMVQGFNLEGEPVSIPHGNLGAALSAGHTLNTRSKELVSQYGTGVGNEAAAFGEGAARTLLPFGIGAAGLNALGDTKEAQLAREQYNPISSMAGSITGAIAPAVATAVFAPEALPELGTAQAAELAPAAGEVAQAGPGLFSAAARMATGGAEGTLPSLARAGIQGALYTDSNAVDQSYLSNQPLTAQALAVNTGLGFLGGAAMEGGLGLVSKAVGAGTDLMKSNLYEATKGKSLGDLADKLDLEPIGGKKGLVDSHLSMDPVTKQPVDPFTEINPNGVNADPASSATKKFQTILDKNGIGGAAPLSQGGIPNWWAAGGSASPSINIVTNLGDALDSFKSVLADPQSFVKGTPQNELVNGFMDHVPSVFANSADGNTAESLSSAMKDAYADAINGHLDNRALSSAVPPSGQPANPWAVSPPEAKGIGKMKNWMGGLRELASFNALLHGHPLMAAANIVATKAGQLAAPFINEQALAMSRYLADANLPSVASGGGLAGKLASSVMGGPHPVIPFQQASVNHLAGAAMDPQTDKYDSVDLGNQIIGAIQKVDKQAGETADSIVTGKGSSSLKPVPEQLQIGKNAKPEDVDTVRDYLSEANGKLVQGNPAISGLGASAIRELQNALPQPPLNLASSPVSAGLPANLSSAGKWNPNPADIQNFNQVAAALNDPLGTLSGLQKGRVTANQIGAISRVYPDIMGKVQEKVAAQIRSLGEDTKLPLATRNVVRSFLSNGTDLGIPQQTLVAITTMPHPSPSGTGGKPSRITPAKEIKLGSRMATPTQKVASGLDDEE